jgi:hypothetical protein
MSIIEKAVGKLEKEGGGRRGDETGGDTLAGSSAVEAGGRQHPLPRMSRHRRRHPRPRFTKSKRWNCRWTSWRRSA